MLLRLSLLGLSASVVAAAILAKRRRRPPVAVRVTYWGGRGKAEPLRCILAAGGVAFEQRFLGASTGKAELKQLRADGRLTYDQLPLVECDGLALVQGSATATYLGKRLGLLPADAEAAFSAEREYAASQDARGPLMAYPFADYPNPPSDGAKARTLAECEGARGLLGRYAPKWEAMLQASGGPFFAGDTPSIADVGVFEALDFFSELFGSAQFNVSFAPFPALRRAFCATRSLGRLAAHCEEERAKYATYDSSSRSHAHWIEYARAVRATLS